MIYLKIYLFNTENLLNARTLRISWRPVGRGASSPPRPLRWLRFRRTPWRGHEPRRHARRTDAGAGRPAADRARLHRPGTAPPLRDHQAGRGENRRLVLTEPRHRLSDADLPRGSGLRHRLD